MRITTDRSPTLVALRRLGWFGGLWLGGVVAVVIVAGALRWVLHAH